MMSMDADKSKDTLVYAKFLANVKDKWGNVSQAKSRVAVTNLLKISDLNKQAIGSIFLWSLRRRESY